ncbi:MAG: hypothetical protein LBR69_02355 [Endomicrobium sp.]|jgi:hypothetical protein|nr:hypothetical protein [Endomicrobium sp.]
MKRKILSLSAAVLFLSGIIIAPAYCFVSEFIVKEKLYSDLNVKSFSKNIVLADSSKINFSGFTENLFGTANKDFDSSNAPALLNKDVQKINFTSYNSFNFHAFGYKSPLFYDFSASERLRSQFAGRNCAVLFVFFILLYIGMLRSVFVFSKTSNLFYILKPLFTQTRVFHLRLSK